MVVARSQFLIFQIPLRAVPRLELTFLILLSPLPTSRIVGGEPSGGSSILLEERDHFPGP